MAAHGHRDHSQVRPNDVTDHADQWRHSRDHRQSAVRSRIRDHSTGLANMLSLLAVAGHHNYAKSARLCLQIMNRLETSYPWLYDQFLLHGHTVQRSDHFWAARAPEAVWQVWRPPYESKIWYGDAIPIKSKAANLFIICNKSGIKTSAFLYVSEP